VPGSGLKPPKRGGTRVGPAGGTEATVGADAPDGESSSFRYGRGQQHHKQQGRGAGGGAEDQHQHQHQHQRLQHAPHPLQKWLAANVVADVDLTILYRFFDDGTIVILLTALLANVSIVFVARDQASELALTDVQEALMSLLTPFGWQYP
jgi:hypothetical protein